MLTVATLVLSVWSVVGSYKNESYLTGNYLFGFQMTNLNITAAFDAGKRDLGSQWRTMSLYKKDSGVGGEKRDANPVLPARSAQNLDLSLDGRSDQKHNIGERQDGRNDHFGDEKKRNVQSDPVVGHAPRITVAPTPTELGPPDLRARATIDTTNIAQLLSDTSALGGLLSTAGIDTKALGGMLLSAGIDPKSLASEFATATELDQLQLLASAASLPASLATLAASFDGDVNQIVSELASSINATDLGFAEYYSVGFWGYCRGTVEGSEEWLDNLGSFGKQFSNKNVQFSYCSPPQAGYKLDPLELVKRELTNALQGDAAGLPSGLSQMDEQIQAQVLALVSAVTYEDLGLPGSLKNDLDLLHNLTVASFALMVVGAGLAVISLICQCVGLCCLPENTCLLCLAFMLMVLVLVATLVGSALSTGAYMFTRNQVNDHVTQYGVQGWLSVEYYALLWLAAAAALLLVVIAFLGYCCGCFHSGKRRYRLVNNEPQMGYYYKGGESG